MTCIVGVMAEGRPWIGADSGITDDDTVHCSAGTKIWRSGHAVIGGAGAVEALQLARLMPPPRIDPPDGLWRYLMMDWMPRLQHFFIERGFSDNEDWEFIFALGSEMFVIEQNVVLKHNDGIYAIGDGSQVALGSLHTTLGWKSPQRRLLKALQIAEELVPSVRGEFEILTP